MRILWLVLIVLMLTQIPQVYAADHIESGGYPIATPTSIPQTLLEIGGK